MATKNVWQKFFFHPSLFYLFLDPGSEIRDPGWVKIRIRIRNTAYKRWGNGERPQRMAMDKCIEWMWLNECVYVIKIWKIKKTKKWHTASKPLKIIRITCCGSVTFWYGSRVRASDLWIRILLFSSLTFKTPPKKYFFFFYLLLFEGAFTSFFKDESQGKVTEKSQNCRNQGFPDYFC